MGARLWDTVWVVDAAVVALFGDALDGIIGVALLAVLDGEGLEVELEDGNGDVDAGNGLVGETRELDRDIAVLVVFVMAGSVPVPNVIVLYGV